MTSQVTYSRRYWGTSSLAEEIWEGFPEVSLMGLGRVEKVGMGRRKALQRLGELLETSGKGGSTWKGSRCNVSVCLSGVWIPDQWPLRRANQGHQDLVEGELACFRGEARERGARPGTAGARPRGVAGCPPGRRVPRGARCHPQKSLVRGQSWDLGRRPSGRGQRFPGAPLSRAELWHLKFKAAKKIK